MDDKLPLDALVSAITTDWVKAVSAVEADYPGWEVGATTIVARGALVLKEGRILVDLDEPERLMIDIPIPLRRK